MWCIFVHNKKINEMTKEQFNELTEKEQSLYVYIEDNINDLLVNELTKEELIESFFNNLKYRNERYV